MRLEDYPYGHFYFVFRPTRNTGQLFELFAKVFRSFPPRGNFFDGPKIFQILAESAAIRLVQKSSKSEPSSRFFSHLKFRKGLSVCVLPKFPRRIQNRNGHMIFHFPKICLQIVIVHCFQSYL